MATVCNLPFPQRAEATRTFHARAVRALRQWHAQGSGPLLVLQAEGRTRSRRDWGLVVARMQRASTKRARLPLSEECP